MLKCIALNIFGNGPRFMQHHNCNKTVLSELQIIQSAHEYTHLWQQIRKGMASVFLYDNVATGCDT